MNLFRLCRCYPLRPRVCESCRDFLNRLKQRKRDIREQTAAPSGAPTLRELRAANQARIRRERYGDDAA